MSLFNKLNKNKINSPKKLFETFLIVTLIAVTTMGSVFDTGLKEVTVKRIDAFANTQDSYKVRTRQENVHGLFKEKGIEVAEDEILTFSLTDSLEHGEILEIRQGKPITIVADGTRKNVLTSKANVANALVENGIKIGANDWAEPGFETPVTEGMVITLRRITVKEETVTEAIECYVENRTDNNMYEDEKNVVEGEAGEKQKVYKVMYDDAGEVYRELISETVTKEPGTTIVTVGTKKRVLTATKGGRTFTYSRKFTVKATAYDTSLEENGGYTKTAMGLTPGFGIVAVDPKVIPLGTRLYIESTDDGKSWTYGYCIAGDTGGAIKGNRVDLCYYTQAECKIFGRRNATVYVLG